MMLRDLTDVWASPDDPEIVVHPKSKVKCAACMATYTVQAIGNEKTRALLRAIPVHESALANFMSIFPGHEWGEAERSATAAVQPDADTLHIFLALGGKRACLACGRIEGRFVAVAVVEADR